MGNRAVSDAPEAKAEAPARIAGRYRVIDEVGRGGVATVYRVIDERDGRRMALKRLRLDHSDEKRTHHLNMLEREYRVLAQIVHPCVIEVYDYAAEAREPHYTMELLDGADLRAEAALPWRDACQLMRDVCSSLALLHSRRLLHRDVSPRNVRLTGDGRAKLIDFGAMVPMGQSRAIIGTPPLVAPEVLHGQDPDGRCALFAVGGTREWALTGRYDYPARALRQLPEIWRSPPTPPSALAPEVPAALDTLVMSLLSLDPAMRPRSAAEVMEHLSVIAGLADDEQLAVTQSYLTTPTLVGRREALATVRHAMIGALGSAGGCIFVQGDAGMGRSRFLDACALEARLLRTRVLRANASDAAGVLGSLRQELGESAALGAALDSATQPHDAEARTASHRLLVEALRGVAEAQPIVVVVDDVERADEPSRAALAAIGAATADARILLLLSARTDHERSPALSLLRDGATVLRLGALSAEEGSQLLRSVFGEPPGLQRVADRIHGLSRGNPGTTMALAQHLVDSGQARYELGGWALPQGLGDRDLPHTLSDALAERLELLDPEARDLADALALALPYGLRGDELAHLVAGGEQGRLQQTLDRLLVAQVLRVDDDRYGFASQAHEELLRTRMSPERRRELFGRLAQALRQGGRDGLDLARCALHSGDEATAIDHLCQELSGGTRWADGPGDYAELLMRAADACSRLGRPQRERFEILRELVWVGHDLSVPGIPVVLQELLEQLSQQSGLHDYRTLPEQMEPGERLGRALQAAQQRHDAADPKARGLEPLLAVRELAQLVRRAAAFATASLDHGLVSSLPDLTPFVALSPAIALLVDHTLPGCEALTAGRFEEGRDHFERVLERLQAPDRAGLEPEMAEWSINALRFALGQLAAGSGLDRALEFAEQLAQESAWILPAWDIRCAYYLRQGNIREVQEARRQIERLQLARPNRPPMMATSARLELEAYAHADDLMGVKRARERLEELIEIHRGFAPYRHYALAEYERLRGNHEAALGELARALSMVRPGEHAAWPYMATCHINVLTSMGREREAVEQGRAYAQRAHDEGLTLMSHYVGSALAKPEAMIGDFEHAVERLERGLRYHERLQSRGLIFGRMLEIRAWVAIRMGDREAFVRYSERCAQQYRKGEQNSALARRYEALMREARAAGLSVAPKLESAGAAQEQSDVRTIGESVASALDACDSGAERGSRALAMLLEHTGARRGALYLVHGHETRLAASSFDGAVPEDLQEIARGLVAIELDEGSTAMLTAHQMGPRTQVRRDIRPILLTCQDERGVVVAGAATLTVQPGQYRPMPFQLTEAIARYLVDAGDVLRAAS
ncbi:MAG: protein kinase [Myxococcales bacterium]|nr:protein kinase [Myxococcales bacterium]